MIKEIHESLTSAFSSIQDFTQAEKLQQLISENEASSATITQLESKTADQFKEITDLNVRIHDFETEKAENKKLLDQKI